MATVGTPPLPANTAAEMLERRSLVDRRSGDDRRLLAGNGAASRVITFLSADRRSGTDRRSGVDRRAPQPALVRVRRR